MEKNKEDKGVTTKSNQFEQLQLSKNDKNPNPNNDTNTNSSASNFGIKNCPNCGMENIDNDIKCQHCNFNLNNNNNNKQMVC